MPCVGWIFHDRDGSCVHHALVRAHQLIENFSFTLADPLY